MLCGKVLTAEDAEERRKVRGGFYRTSNDHKGFRDLALELVLKLSFLSQRLVAPDQTELKGCQRFSSPVHEP